MEIARVRVKGYRPLLDVSVEFEGLNSLIGPNGSGKSSLMGALSLFFSPELEVDERDFWQTPGGARVDEVTISVTFTDLSEEAATAFADYLTAGELTVERHFNESGRGEYLAKRAAVPEFSRVRSLPKGHRDAYNELVDEDRFEELERASSKDDAFMKMAAWEAANPERCEPTVESVPFVVRSAGELDAIATYLRFFFIPALEEPSRHLEADGSGAISGLVREVVDTAELEDRLAAIADDADQQGAAVLASMGDLFGPFIAATGDQLGRFAPGYELELSLEELPPIKAPRPRVRALVKTPDGLATNLAYQGQGVQRSLMYAVLTAQAALERRDASRTIVLAMEEPEAFQHPLSCQVLGRTLMELTERGYQVVYSTHSPDFLRPEAVTGIRLVTFAAHDQGASPRIEAVRS